MSLTEYTIKIVDANGQPMLNFPMATRYVGSDKKNNKLTGLDDGILSFKATNNRSVELFVLAPINSDGTTNLKKFKEDNDNDDYFYRIATLDLCKAIPTKISSPYKLSDYGIAKTKFIFYENKKNMKKYIHPLTVKIIYLTGKSTSFIENQIDVKDGELKISSIMHSRIQVIPLKPDNTNFKNQGNDVKTSYSPRTTDLVEIGIFFDIFSITGTTEPNKPKINEPIKKEACGLEYRGKVKCTKYGSVYGPVFWGSMPIDSYTHWDKLIEKGLLDEIDKIAIMGVAPNEGKLDAVQSYDSEILTAGAMQKTINPTGFGELPTNWFWRASKTNLQISTIISKFIYFTI